MDEEEMDATVPEEGVKWYTCLVVHKQRKFSPKKRKRSKCSRTAVHVTHEPIRMLKILNDTGRNKPVRTLGNNTRTRRRRRRKDESPETTKYEFACIVGPFEKEQEALLFHKYWEGKSRGLQPRCVWGLLLASKLEYEATVNWYSAVSISEDTVFIYEGDEALVFVERKNDDTVKDLEIYAQEALENYEETDDLNSEIN